MQNNLYEIQNKLSAVTVKEHKRNALNGFYLFVPIVCFLFALFSFAETLGEFNSLVRGILFYVFIITALLILAKLIVLPLLKLSKLFSPPNYIATAAKVGVAFPEIKDELLNALQLISSPHTNYSPQLIEAAFHRIYIKTKNYNFLSVVDFSSLKKSLRFASAAILAFIILFFTVPGFSFASYRIINYGKNFSASPKFIFEVLPGNKEITKGENVKIIVRALGNTPKEIFLSTKQEDQTEFAEKKLTADSSGRFIYETTSVNNSFEYFASADKIKSDVFRISVINRPIITNIELTVVPPAYSQLPQVVQRDNGNISALPGSRINVSINSSRELENASINFSDSTSKQIIANGMKAVSVFSIFKEMNYQINIVDKQNHSNINPIVYSIKLLHDLPPSIEMVSPNQNIKLGKETKISLISKISDDYGFSKMNLNYRLSASKYRSTTDVFTQIPITISSKHKEDETYFVWDLAPLVLAEGEVISYYLEVFDNDNITGPKSAKTQQFTITVPSMDELLAESDTKQEDALKDLAKTLKDADNLNKEMQKITEALKQNTKDISWQEKERIQNAQDKFKEISKKVEDVSQKLSEMKNELAKNNMLSEETMKKYDELQKLLDQINSDELKQAFQKMQDALQNMMRDNVQMSMEELKANEEYLKKSLERTLNLLKRIQIEQKLDELKNRIDDITKKLDELKNKTEKSNLSDKQKQDELTNRQKDVSDDLNKLGDEMEKLNKKMNELSDMPKDQMEKLMQEFEKQMNEEMSKDAEKNLQQQQKSPTMQNQQQISQNMQKMGKQVRDMQSAMQQMNQMKTFSDMMKILNDLLSLSKDQENLKNSTEQLSPYSSEFTEKSRQQNEIGNNLEKVFKNMSALSQKTFAITPEMGKSLGNALSKIQEAMNALHIKNGQYASQQQREAMASLNEAAELMKNGMNQMMSGGQGNGMMSLMQQLQKLGQQQMDLNQLTQMLNQGQMSQEMMSQIQRLAQQQEMIRKSLEQLNKEAKQSGESKRLAANLDKVLDEMKEVVTNMQTEKVNDDLVKQQQKILSKLLDAQRSINERDYEDERKSDVGKNYNLTSPAELILSTDEGKNKLKDELMKAVKEGYKKDYEELIRKYFDSLQKDKKSN